MFSKISNYLQMQRVLKTLFCICQIANLTTALEQERTSENSLLTDLRHRLRDAENRAADLSARRVSSEREAIETESRLSDVSARLQVAQERLKEMEGRSKDMAARLSTAEVTEVLFAS